MELDKTPIHPAICGSIPKENFKLQLLLLGINNTELKSTSKNATLLSLDLQFCVRLWFSDCCLVDMKFPRI